MTSLSKETAFPLRFYDYGDYQKASLDWEKGWLDQLLRMRLSYPEQTGFDFLNKDGETEISLDPVTLDLEAQKTAALLRRFVPKGARILLLAGNHPCFLSGFFGALYAGCIPVSGVSPAGAGAQKRLEAILSEAQPEIVFGLREDLEAFQPLFPLAEAQWLPAETAQYEEEGLYDPTHKDRLETAFIQYTSGTEGAPRGVPVSHAAILTNLNRQAVAFSFSKPAPGVGWLPFTHDMGLIGSVLVAVALAQKFYVQKPEDFIASPIRWLRAISEKQAVFSGGPSFAYELVARLPAVEREGLDLSSWQRAVVGGEQVSASTLDLFAKNFKESGFERSFFRPCYGMAETTLMLSCSDKPVSHSFSRQALSNGRAVPLSEKEIGDTQKRDRRTLISCGFPIEGHEIRIMGEGGEDFLPEGQTGEIWVRGPCVVSAYLPSVKENNSFSGKKFPFAEVGKGEKWFRTGDLGFLQGGEIFIFGRMEEALRQDGKNYDMYDLAEEIRQELFRFYPQYGSKNFIDGILVYKEEGRIQILLEVLSAFEEMEAAALKIAQALNRLCGARAVRVIWAAFRELERTSSGKIRFQAARQAVVLGKIRIWKAYEFGSSDLETQIFEEMAWVIP